MSGSSYRWRMLWTPCCTSKIPSISYPMLAARLTAIYRLCHIVHGPHDEPFHTLWNQLRSEHENLISKGYTGERFLSTGHKLGGARIPKHEAGRRARASAEKRRTLTAGSGQKLGGQPVQRGQDIRKVIADAATRRATVTKGCASGTERGRGIVEETTKNGTRTKAEEEDADEEAIMQAYIEMIQQEERGKYGDAYLPPSSVNPAGSQGIGIARAPPPIPRSTKPGNGQKGPVVDLTDYEKPEDVRHSSRTPFQDTWTCDICTLENPSTYVCCDACATDRPESSFRNRSYSPPPQSAPGSSSPSNWPQTSHKNKSVKALSSLNSEASKKPMGWLCHRCGTFMESQWWTCASCGVMKLSS